MIGAPGVPAADVPIDTALVHALLTEQHPDLAGLPLIPADSGWDNVMYRLGDRLAVRLPRRAAALPYHETEQRWLPVLASRLPLPVPSALRRGRPGHGYPWTWSVVPWLEGVAADRESANRNQVTVLAAFLDALHVPAPADAPHNPYRSVPLADRDSYLRERWEALERASVAIPAGTRRDWADGVDAPIDLEPTWIHGDLHARNILVLNGRLSGVVDWGDACRGDRATDLASVWMLFGDSAVRASALDACGATRPTRARARAWAIYFATMFAHAGLASDARHASLGAGILERVASDHRSNQSRGAAP